MLRERSSRLRALRGRPARNSPKPVGEQRGHDGRSWLIQTVAIKGIWMPQTRALLGIMWLNFLSIQTHACC